MNKIYFAVAGHDRLLTEAELSINNDIISKFKFVDKYIYYVAKPVDADKAGSVSFSGSVFSSENYEDLYSKLIETITEKKVNIYFNTNLKLDAKQIKKESPAKHLNIKKNAFPNFGNLKSGQNFIITKFNNIFSLFIVDSYADQSKYKFIDEKLPFSDLKKGIINLKLAKSMLNLTEEKVILDPFAGFGRIAFADYNKDRKYYMTDIDDICQKYMTQNNNFMLENFKGEDNITILNTANFVDLSSKVDKIIIEDSFSIVTEGTLGKNFGKKVPVNLVLSEQTKVIRLWQDCIKNLARSEKIQDLVFCIPFTNEYAKTKSNILSFIEEVEKKYPLISFLEFEKGKKVVFYSRGKSFIGHGLLKATFN